MPLSEEQIEELYKKTIENRKDIQWIRERLQQGDEKMANQNSRINRIEREQALFKGKMGAFIFFLAMCISVAAQGMVWIVSHIFNLRSG